MRSTSFAGREPGILDEGNTLQALLICPLSVPSPELGGRFDAL
jgi:hypothetical protein